MSWDGGGQQRDHRKGVVPSVWVGPDAHRELIEAVQRGGGNLADPTDASVIVWSSRDEGPEALRPLLHPGIRLVQLDSAGVDYWIASGIVDADRIWAGAQGAYAHILAEHALTLLLAAAKGLPQAARADSWNADHGTRRLEGSTVGLVGAGGIARRLVTLLAPIDVELLAVNRSGTAVGGVARTVGPEGLDGVLAQSAYVVVTAPLTPATRHLIGPVQLELIGPDGWLINVGRGGVVDTSALVSALASGSIGGACLDVTDPEPLPKQHPLWSFPNVLVTPHVANPWGDHLRDYSVRIEENIRRFGAGDPIVGVIDVTHGY